MTLAADTSFSTTRGFHTANTWTRERDDELAALVSQGEVTQDQLDNARRRAKRIGMDTALILMSDGLVTELEIAQALGREWGIPAIDITTADFDEDLVRRRSGREYIERGWVPIRRGDDTRMIVATFYEITPERRAAIESELGEAATYVACGRWAMREALLRVYRDAIAQEAANSLAASNPALSARTVFSKSQKVWFVVALVVLAVALSLWPFETLIAFVTAVSFAYLLATGFKYIVSLRGSRYDFVEQISVDEIASLIEDRLPVYTVLVPVFHEANIVGQLLENLGRLNYPRYKLEVLILVEEEDDETQAAIAATNPPFHFHTIVIPRGQPQTKPRACNVGLTLATGEFLVIYDAEDRPDPDQLKKAVIAFRRGGDDLVCVQASLSFFNVEENALTRMFTLEYGFWFYYMLSGLDASRLPIPLGGTSNHFRVRQLRELGGWDPYNVTEDADLGIRASALGYRVGIINSTTLEEANTQIPNFIRQRSRWIKGYMQTSLVHARQPRKLIREIGVVPFFAFVLLVFGTPITFLGVIPSYLITTMSIWFHNATLAGIVPTWTMWVMIFNFMIGNVIMVETNMMGPFKRGRYGLVPWAILNPLYWVLHSIASYKALWQLVTRPHYWEKTNHGLTTQSA